MGANGPQWQVRVDANVNVHETDKRKKTGRDERKCVYCLCASTFGTFTITYVLLNTMSLHFYLSQQFVCHICFLLVVLNCSAVYAFVCAFLSWGGIHVGC